MTDRPEPAPPPTCTCLPPWSALATVIEGASHLVVPAPASALYLAHCTGCGAAYTGPWKRLTSSSRAA
ncbi:hypothetical protein ABT124_48760 [Streptomyces sp. NPDC001982]|uniref:hypothetical protein n=1 Tax=Streptomyces sp. NPDC001982 TaxID=3154405 RepID=UPI0033337669